METIFHQCGLMPKLNRFDPFSDSVVHSAPKLHAAAPPPLLPIARPCPITSPNNFEGWKRKPLQSVSSELRPRTRGASFPPNSRRAAKLSELKIKLNEAMQRLSISLKL